MPSMTKPEIDIARGFRLGADEWFDACPKTRRALVRKARERYWDVREGMGLSRGAGDMFTKPDAQPKTGKSERYTLILMMLPAHEAGVGNLCPPSTEGCRKDCLNWSGHGEMPASQAARLARTVFMVQHSFSAAVLVCHEISLAQQRVGSDIGVRLNGTTDLRWELIAPAFLARWKGEGVTFYDYTKWAPRLRQQAEGLIHLTYSAHERQEPDYWADMVLQGFTVAIIVRSKADAVAKRVRLGALEVPTLNGDLSDDRTLDKPGHLVLLSPKGNRIWHNTTGFTFDVKGKALVPHLA